MGPRAEVEHVDLTELARDLAGCLGAEWTGEPGSRSGYTATVRRRDGAGFLLWCEGYQRPGRDQRVEVRGEYPKVEGSGTSDYGSSYDRRVKVSVSASRPPSAIARDLARRFLPAYLGEWAEAVARARRADDHRVQTEALGRDLALALGARPGVYQGGEVTLRVDGAAAGKVWGSFRVSGDDVRLELHSLTGCQAAEVARVLAGERGGQGPRGGAK